MTMGPIFWPPNQDSGIDPTFTPPEMLSPAAFSTMLGAIEPTIVGTSTDTTRMSRTTDPPKISRTFFHFGVGGLDPGLDPD